MLIDSNRPSNRLLVIAFVAIFFTFGGTAWILYYLGLFSHVQLRQIQTANYRIAYRLNTGPYNELKHVFTQISQSLDNANTTYSAACALFLDDPSVVNKLQLRSKVCYLVAENVNIPSSLQTEIIPSHEVISAIFDGSPMLGSYKAYAAMKKWAARNGYKLSLPSFEIYQKNGSVEYQLPITKQ